MKLDHKKGLNEDFTVTKTSEKKMKADKKGHHGTSFWAPKIIVDQSCWKRSWKGSPNAARSYFTEDKSEGSSQYATWTPYLIDGDDEQIGVARFYIRLYVPPIYNQKENNKNPTNAKRYRQVVYAALMESVSIERRTYTVQDFYTKMSAEEQTLLFTTNNNLKKIVEEVFGSEISGWILKQTSIFSPKPNENQNSSSWSDGQQSSGDENDDDNESSDESGFELSEQTKFSIENWTRLLRY